MFQDRGQYREILFTDCGQLIKNQEFISCMQEILTKLQEHYGKAVDIEYTVNISETGEFLINLLQCRPLQTGDTESVKIPACKKRRYFFPYCQKCNGIFPKAENRCGGICGSP